MKVKVLPIPLGTLSRDGNLCFTLEMTSFIDQPISICIHDPLNNWYELTLSDETFFFAPEWLEFLPDEIVAQHNNLPINE